MSQEKGMTIQEAAQKALVSQNSCNLSGVVKTFAEVTSVLWEQPDCDGTDWVNEHPISILFATQVLWLTCKAIWPGDYGKAYAACEMLRDEGTPEITGRCSHCDKVIYEGDSFPQGMCVKCYVSYMDVRRY